MEIVHEKGMWKLGQWWKVMLMWHKFDVIVLDGAQNKNIHGIVGWTWKWDWEMRAFMLVASFDVIGDDGRKIPWN